VEERRGTRLAGLRLLDLEALLLQVLVLRTRLPAEQLQLARVHLYFLRVIQGFGFRVSDLGSGLGFRVSGFGFRI